jgi:preprotein translocase subunit SecF
MESMMINFLKYRFLCGIISVIMFTVFIGDFIYKKQTTGSAFTYSVEFVGGTQILLKFQDTVSSNQIKDILEHAGWPGVVTREFSDREIIIRVKEVSTDVRGLGEKIKQILAEQLPANPVAILKTDSISEGIGEALTWNSILAIIVSLFFMLLYIGWRFWSISFAVGAVVSLIHDAIAILLFFMLAGKDISTNTIMAVLAILGYSLNDTIVIFTRIRENIVAKSSLSMDEIVNLSINQTLRRTILTSFATSLVVIALILLGGETLRDLSLALLIGIVFGTYSSIYIASPVMLLLYNKNETKNVRVSKNA